MFPQRILVSLEPIDSCAGGGAAKVGDSFATNLDEMFGGQSADGHIIHSHKTCSGRSEAAINQDVRRPLLIKPLENLAVGGRGGDDKGIQAAAQKLFNLLPLQLRVAVGSRQDQAISLL